MQVNFGLLHYYFCQKGKEFSPNLFFVSDVVLVAGVFPEDVGRCVVDHACIYRNYVVQQSQQRNVRLLKVNETFSLALHRINSQMSVSRVSVEVRCRNWNKTNVYDS